MRSLLSLSIVLLIGICIGTGLSVSFAQTKPDVKVAAADPKAAPESPEVITVAPDVYGKYLKDAMLIQGLRQSQYDAALAHAELAKRDYEKANEDEAKAEDAAKDIVKIPTDQHKAYSLQADNAGNFIFRRQK